MSTWNKLLTALDHALGFQNKVASNVVKKWQGFDNVTQEHVVQLEYRIKTRPAEPPKPSPHKATTINAQEESLIRELLKVLKQTVGADIR